MPQHIIFDLDGTLVDSKQEILNAYRQVTKKIPTLGDIDFNALDFTETIQNNLAFIYKKNEALMLEAKKQFAEIYDHSEFENTLLYEGTYETLKYLHSQNHTLHIATNKRLKPTLRIIERKRLSPFISSVKASDQTEGKVSTKTEMVKEICAENNLISGFMIGDSKKDIEAGRICGLTTVAVTYGYEKKEDLILKKPNFVIDSISDLIKIVNR